MKKAEDLTPRQMEIRQKQFKATQEFVEVRDLLATKEKRYNMLEDTRCELELQAQRIKTILNDERPELDALRIRCNALELAVKVLEDEARESQREKAQ